MSAPTLPLGVPSRVRVLVVDDNDGFRESLASLVDGEGMEIIGQACSGPEAIEMVRALAPDVVLMDVRMPDMDGIEAARLVAAERPDVTVLLVSAEPLASPAADLLRSRAAVFSRKQNFGPALLRLLKLCQDTSAPPGTQP